MANYDKVAGIDSGYNFPPEVRRAFAASSELINQIETEIGNDDTIHAAVLQAIEDALAAGNVSFSKGAISSSTNINTLVSGVYEVNTSLQNLAAYGLPPRLGNLYNSQHGSGGFTQIFVSAATDTYGPELWIRASHGNAALLKPNFERVYPYVEKTKTCAFTLNFERGTDYESGRNRQYRIPFKLGANAKLRRVAFVNYDYNSDTAGSGVVTLNGVGVGKHNIAEDGSMSGRFIPTEPVEEIYRGTSLVVSNVNQETFTDDVEIPLEANVDYLLSYSYTADDTATVRRMLGRNFMNTQVGSWASTSQTVTATPQTYMGLHVWMELEVSSDTPVWAYVGDSQLAGLSTDNPGYDSWGNKHAFNNGAIPQMLAQPGGSLADYQDVNTRKLRKWRNLDRPDRLYLALGTNDIGNGRPLTGVKEFYEVAAKNIMGVTSKNLYSVAVLPRGVVHPDTDAVRLGFNEYLRDELPMNAVNFLDHWSALVNPTTGLTDSRWLGDDTTHINTQGNARLAQASDGLVLEPIKPYTVPDTGLRSINPVNGSTGMIFIRRVGSSVTLFFRDIVTPETNTTFASLQVGFRPDYSPRYDVVGRTGGRDLVVFTLNSQSINQNGSKTGPFYGGVTYNTNDPWPTTLPGTPA